MLLHIQVLKECSKFSFSKFRIFYYYFIKIWYIFESVLYPFILFNWSSCLCFLHFQFHSQSVEDLRKSRHITIFRINVFSSILFRLCLTQNTLQLQLLYYFFFFSTMFLDRLAKVIFSFLSNCYFKHMWPGLKLLIWYSGCFNAMFFRYK